jgi:hypothetical protein
MKRLHHQHVGFLLIVAAILAAALIQWVGPPLVVVEHPAPPPPAMTQDGIKFVTGIRKTRFHFALIPLVIIGTVGFVLAMIPTRDERSR